MKNLLIIFSLVILLSACAKQQEQTTLPAESASMDSSTDANKIEDTEMGLSKTSVFETPEPQPVKYSEQFPGSNAVLPRAYPGAPPQIPHNIDSFKPITAKSNACIGCHNNPSQSGKEVPKGTPTPMPKSHYTDIRHKPDTVRDEIVEARYVCTQCHVPQATAAALVDNSFESESSR